MSKTLFLALSLTLLAAFAGCRDLPKQQDDVVRVADVSDQGTDDVAVSQTDVTPVESATDVSQTVVPSATDQAAPDQSDR